MNLKQPSRLAALIITTTLFLGVLYLLVVGMPHRVVPETLPGQALPLGQVVYRPYLPAIYAVPALLFILIGLLRDKWLLLAWAGMALLVLFGGLLIFSMGFYFIAAGVVLAVALGVLQWR